MIICEQAYRREQVRDLGHLDVQPTRCHFHLAQPVSCYKQLCYVYVDEASCIHSITCGKLLQLQ